MPRLSLYKPEKGQDYKFIDKTIYEMFQVGGTDIYIHKYLGPRNPTEGEATADQPRYDSVKETNIQDLLLMENRDAIYDPDIFRIRGVYNVSDIDFNLSQFGLFIDNDTLYMTVHINETIRTLGRKPLSGDVLEIPHLKDEFALNDFDVSLPRYFVLSDVGRAAEGFSPTWYPHLYRLKLTKMTDSQKYKDIFNQKIIDPVTGEETDTTLSDLLSSKNKMYEINDIMLAQAEADSPRSGYETRHFYTLAVDENGNAALHTVDAADLDASIDTLDASAVNKEPKRPGYAGYLLGDGVPDNGAEFGHGITFPNNAIDGDYFLRTDFLPNRLFRFDGMRWVKREDISRTTLSNTDNRNTQKFSFINNTNKTGVGLLYSDVLTVNSYEVNTDINYIDTMYASGESDNTATVELQVSRNNLGKTRIMIPNVFAIGESTSIKLYTSAFSQRQALSKVTKPRADI